MDTNKFFRHATLRICGDLQIEKALCRTLRYLRDFIPVDRMFLQIYEPALGAMRTMASADRFRGEEVHLLTPLPRPARDPIRGSLAEGSAEAVIIDSPEGNPVAREMLRFHGIPGHSILRMTLTMEEGRIGGVVLTAKGSDRYTKDHAYLLSLLREPFTVAMSNTLEHREVQRLQDRLADDNRYLRRELHRISGDEIVGADFGLKPVLRMVRQVAPTESPVLLTGEAGVGKDVLANAIHLASDRREGPFIAVNCGAIPDSLIDSEIFGHEKGSFTGALDRKRGRFERAHQGTILLDEIGEMPLGAQVRLLRVLQNHEIERIGGTERIPVDVRVVASTNLDLQERVASGRFREDLWFRLNVFPIAIPPLRDRKSDIPALAQHFIERKARDLKLGATPELAPGAIDDLLAYSWPGNVREMENLIERAMILDREGPLRFDLGERSPPREDESIPALDTVVKRHIRRALGVSGGKVHGPGGAAEILRVNPNTLRHRMRKLRIPFGRSVR